MLRSSVFWARATLRLMRHRRHFVRQTGQTDCGVACTLTLMNLMGRKADPVEAVELLDSERVGSSLEALRLYFTDTQGLEATALKVPVARLKQIKGHVILHMTQKHYVLLLQRDARGVLVFDPAMGVVYYPMADFAALYSGFLLEVPGRKVGEGRALAPVNPSAGLLAGGRPDRGSEPYALFFLGIAGRLLEGAVILCLVTALFLILNHASFPSLLTVFALVALCGGLLLATRQLRFEAEDGWGKRKQGRLWRGVLRAVTRDRDLNGFRGRFERDVSGSVRRGMMTGIPQRSQIPGALGALAGMSGLLAILSPTIALVHLGLFGFLLVLMQLDDIQVCRRSVRKGIGRYSRLSQSIGLPGQAVAPDLMGEIAKWGVIGFAGFGVLLSDIPPVALMFWILVGMQIVPSDFRKVRVLVPLFGQGETVSSLVAVEVPLRRQRVVGEAKLKRAEKDGVLRIDGLGTLTQGLQQPDLTVREQRLIMADVVRLATSDLPEAQRPDPAAIRIFGPGQDATQADFEHLLIARESATQREAQKLPAVQNARAVMEQAMADPVLRDLHSCAPEDFPVFWDFRAKMSVTDLQARLAGTGLTRAGHLTMTRLTVVRAA